MVRARKVSLSPRVGIEFVESRRVVDTGFATLSLALHYAQLVVLEGSAERVAIPRDFQCLERGRRLLDAVYAEIHRLLYNSRLFPRARDILGRCSRALSKALRDIDRGCSPRWVRAEKRDLELCRRVVESYNGFLEALDRCFEIVGEMLRVVEESYSRALVELHARADRRIQELESRYAIAVQRLEAARRLYEERLAGCSDELLCRKFREALERVRREIEYVNEGLRRRRAEVLAELRREESELSEARRRIVAGLMEIASTLTSMSVSARRCVEVLADSNR